MPVLKRASAKPSRVKAPLMPALVRVATGVTLPVVGGLVVSALTLSGAISVLLLRSVPARRRAAGARAPG